MNVQGQTWFRYRDKDPSSNIRSEVRAISLGEEVRGGGKTSPLSSAECFCSIHGPNEDGSRFPEQRTSGGFCHLEVAF